ncbi:MAG: hypothetical protein HYY06_25145 [Deltaproteobacteria bacterium]|nr:hypothetical protein [Deltaproteobacteria bacterium]
MIATAPVGARAQAAPPPADVLPAPQVDVGDDAAAPPSEPAAPVGEATSPAPAERSAAGSAEPEPTEENETARRVEILTEEVQRLRERLVLPETEENRSRFGLGPAASRVYGIERGLSIGGYGELHFQGIVSDRSEGETNVFDIPRVVLYAGYKFTPKILVNIELEFEHAKDAEVEFAYLDFLLHDAVAVRAGLVLLPVGLVNELHEPPFFNGNLRPLVERRLIPTTWRELGVGLVGEPIEGLDYRVYLVTGMRSTGFGPGGWAAGRQHARQAIGNDVAVVGRLDYEVVPELVVGASAYWGGADQGELTVNDGGEVSVDTAMFEAHARLRTRGFEMKALGAYGLVRNAAHVALKLDPEGTATIGSRLAGAYAEVSYDLVPLFAPDAPFSISPWARVEWLDTELEVPELSGRPDDSSQNVTAVAVGIAAKPHTNVVLKAEYLDQRNAAGARMADSVFVGAGFIF